MTNPNPGITAKIAAAADHARPTTCPRCRSPVLTAWAGRVAALRVVADPEPIDATAEILARLNGRLTWFLITSSLGVHRITWRNPTFTPHAKHPVIADHVCPPHPVQETLL
ncbi:hypothetical protein [Streptomyces niveus]|uniref:hypothetical protein n=1 Tax=Streptomyces niveus TaxID=193462 RepID=UPI00084C479B|nr:hypothetical protein [Streptomyces niveus]